MIKAMIRNFTSKRKAARFEAAVKLVQEQGLTVCEIATSAVADYIKAEDGSWRRIGSQRNNKKHDWRCPHKNTKSIMRDEQGNLFECIHCNMRTNNPSVNGSWRKIGKRA